MVCYREGDETGSLDLEERRKTYPAAKGSLPASLTRKTCEFLENTFWN